MRKLQNSQTYKPKPEFFEKNIGKGLTIPNETMDIKTILKRSQQGLAEDIIRRAVYTDAQFFSDLDLSKVDTMDLVEVAEIADRTRERIDTLTKKMKEAEEARIEAEKKAAEEAAKVVTPHDPPANPEG